MAKLYQPQIQGTIPAFSKGAALAVPFSMNRAVSLSEIAGMSLKVKTVQGNLFKGEIKATTVNKDTCVAYFDVSGLGLNIGQFYKIQVAFINRDINTGEEEVGYYSTVGVVKYTSQPEVNIETFESDKVNTAMQEYVAVYKQTEDLSEKLYSSYFVLYDKEHTQILKSEEVLHNNSMDAERGESLEYFSIDYKLEDNEIYYIRFYVTTINGYTTSSLEYRLMNAPSVKSTLDATLTLTRSFDDGYIDLHLLGNGEVETATTGRFKILRAASNDDYIWREVGSFVLKNQTPRSLQEKRINVESTPLTVSRGEEVKGWETQNILAPLWRDFTVEQGITYKYAVQQYNEYNIYSERIESEEIVADFEDAFLYDGERQLKIRYNPAINSFKTDILENKIETIGHKYPFIFRNGRVAYKEFPISGLISYLMDDNKLFITDFPNRYDVTSSNTDLSSENFYLERKFKLEVLDWLNNGEKKLFRSPSEGNYIVQLLGNSLSPNATVGRMLHTFSSTAYEVDKFSYETLKINQLLNPGEDLVTSQSEWGTIVIYGKDEALNTKLKEVRENSDNKLTTTFTEEQYNKIIDANPKLADSFKTIQNGKHMFMPTEDQQLLDDMESLVDTNFAANGIINTNPMKFLKFEDMVPGTLITLIFEDGTKETITIGVTGAYEASFDNPVVGINLNNTDSTGTKTVDIQGSVVYNYIKTERENTFTLVQNIDIRDVPWRQWIGHQEKTYYDIDAEEVVTSNNLIKIIEDPKTEIINISQMHFEKRPVQRIFEKSEGKFYKDMDCKEPFTFTEFDEFYIYQVCNPRKDYTYSSLLNWEGDYINSNFSHGYYVDSKGKYLKDGVTAVNSISTEDNAIDSIPERRAGYINANGEYLTRPVDIFLYPVETGFIIDGQYPSKKIDELSYSNEVIINGEPIDITETGNYSIKEFGEQVDSIEFGYGVICSLSYQIRDITYTIEESVEEIKDAKDQYLTLLNSWLSSRNSVAGAKQEKTTLSAINSLYATFMNRLARTLKNYKER